MTSIGLEEQPQEQQRASEPTPGVPQAGAERTPLHDDPVIDVVLTEALAGEDASGRLPEVVAVIDDAEGSFIETVLAHGARTVRVFSDLGLNRPLPEQVQEATPDAGLFAGVSLVLGRLPKSLAELEDLAECINAHAGPDVRVILGARERHLRHSMTDRLSTYFSEVRGTRGMRKSRALVARGMRLPEPEFPRSVRLEELDVVVAARGGVFAGPTLDLGTRVLLETLAGARRGTIAVPDAARILKTVDLGCGTGIVACVLARSFPEAQAIATDASWWACASTDATASANGLADRIEVIRANAGEGIEPGSVDLVLCNPPFHAGRQVDPGVANELFRGASRMLRPGGRMYTVFNSHLKHRQHLERIIGPTRQLNRTEKFTVTESIARD